MSHFLIEVSGSFSRVRFLPIDWLGIAGVSVMHRTTHVTSSSNPGSSTMPPIAPTHQERAKTIIKNPLVPPRRRLSHCSPISGTSCRRVPSSSWRHLGCRPCHHFCHDTLYFAGLVIVGVKPYFRPFFSHVATSPGLSLASILPFFNKY